MITLFTEILSQRSSLGYKALSSHQFLHVAYLSLVRYRNACLRLFVVVQDLHCLQRFYQNIHYWHITLYRHIPILTFSRAFVSEIQKCLPEAICCIVYRDFITTLIIGVLHFTIISIPTFIRAFVSEIQKCLPEAICCCNTRFTLFTEILSKHSSLAYYTLPSYTNFDI